MRPKVFARGLGFTEGPVICTDGSIVVVSFQDARVHRIIDGQARVIAHTGGAPNGAAEWSDGAIFIAQMGGFRPARSPFATGGVQVIGRSGRVDYLTADPVSPNDLCFGPDGLLYVTDPTRPTAGADRYAGGQQPTEDGRLWRCDPETGDAELLASVPWFPNGIGFDRGDDALLVADTTNSRIVRFPVASDGHLGKAETAVRLTHNRPDGFAFDVEGNIVIGAVHPQDPAAPADIQTYDAEGRLVDVFRPGASRYYTNVALGTDRRLYITDSMSGTVLLVEEWPHEGLTLHPFRKAPPAR